MKTPLLLSLLSIAAGCNFDPGSLAPLDGGNDASTPLAVNCMTDSDCDDQVACTGELCQQDHTCLRVPNDGLCKNGEVCGLGKNVGEGGCKAPDPTPPACPASCEDKVACTIDSCGADFACHHLPDATKCKSGQLCDALKGCVDPTPPPMCPATCDDSIDCTVDSCGVDLACHHLVDSSKCPMGQICNPAKGCVAPPAPPSTISCAVSGQNLTLTISGPVQEALVGGAVANPGSIQYGSDSDSWVVPYNMGKALVAWKGDGATYILVVPASVNGFNLFLADGNNSGGRWFDLVDADGNGKKFAVAGACNLMGTKVYH